MAPQYIVAELLKAEGFTDIKYVKMTDRGCIQGSGIRGGRCLHALRRAAGHPAGRWRPHHGLGRRARRLFRAVRDGSGSRDPGSEGQDGRDHRARVDPARLPLQHGGPRGAGSAQGRERSSSIPPPRASALLAEGKVDAYLGFPPDPQELRARKVGHVVVNSAVDRPWSQYFCCIATGHREFVRKHPIATKRALRAILKAADICALEPERAARALVDGGFTPRYDYALQTMKDVPYNKWRVYDPEDSVRFYALRLREAG